MKKIGVAVLVGGLLSVLLTTNVALAGAPATRTVTVKPVTKSLHLASGWSIDKTYKATSCTGSNVNPADLRCFTTNNFVIDPCWPYQSSARAARAAVCPESATSHKLIRVTGSGRPGTSTTTKSFRWAFRLASGNVCYLGTGAADTFHGQVIHYYCAHNVALIGAINKAHASWVVREVVYTSSGKKYGPFVHINTAYNAASYRA